MTTEEQIARGEQAVRTGFEMLMKANAGLPDRERLAAIDRLGVALIKVTAESMIAALAAPWGGS